MISSIFQLVIDRAKSQLIFLSKTVTDRDSPMCICSTIRNYVIIEKYDGYRYRIHAVKVIVIVIRFRFRLIVNTDIVEEDVAYRSTPRNGCTANTVADALL